MILRDILRNFYQDEYGRIGVVKMAFFETLMMKRTIRVLIIILLFQQLKIRGWSDVSENISFSIIIADKTFNVKSNQQLSN